ncbi:MAG: ATP-binding protein [Proteobacteria bacterium]|nr:ATP-binding protein [Pseudomonadota bacterium]
MVVEPDEAGTTNGFLFWAILRHGFMSELQLDSLEITNFRCFEHLTIEKLGRVNLIVGKNSVGKTALLEALWLLGSEGDWAVTQKILYDRNELVRYRSIDSRDELYPDYLERQEQLEAFKSFLYGRPPKNLELTNFHSGTSHTSEGLQTRDAFRFRIATNRQSISLATRNSGSEYDVYLHQDNTATRRINELVKAIPNKPMESALEENSVFSPIMIPPLPKKETFDYSVIGKSKDYKTVFIPLSGLTWKATCTYWDDLALTDREEAIIYCLQVIEPSIKRFTFKGENMDNRVRYSVVKSDRFDNPLPLANFGEGTQRVFAMALAMSTASNGYLLIDEFETGLHHRVLANVWNVVFKLAHEWNVQIFATTHSRDCIEAFQEIATKDEQEQAMLIRLQKRRNGSGIDVVSYDKRRLTIATEENIEVR